MNTDTRFAYQIWNITAPAGRAIDHIMGEFHYDQSGDEVHVTWNYNIKPRVLLCARQSEISSKTTLARSCARV